MDSGGPDGGPLGAVERCFPPRPNSCLWSDAVLLTHFMYSKQNNFVFNAMFMCALKQLLSKHSFFWILCRARQCILQIKTLSFVYCLVRYTEAVILHIVTLSFVYWSSYTPNRNTLFWIPCDAYRWSSRNTAFFNTVSCATLILQIETLLIVSCAILYIPNRNTRSFGYCVVRDAEEVISK